MSTPVNVLYLIRTWALGGSHTIIFLLLKHLPRDRFNIITVPFDSHSGGDELFVAEAEKRGIAVAPERIPWKSRGAWGQARKAVGELIKQYDIGLVHAHDPHTDVLIGLGRKRWPCACVASPYGWWDRIFPLRSHVYTWIERQWALPQFERLITVSQHMKGKILRGPSDPGRVRVIHTGLDLAQVQHGDGDAARARYGLPPEAVVVGTVSRIYVEKGHTYLMHAAARLKDLVPPVYLLIVGDGPLRPDLEAEAVELGIQDRVVFTGFCEDLPGALAAMDVFALPSILEEGFPTAVLEAQAAGLPVIATDKGGTRETIDVGQTGLLVPPKDAASLAGAIAELAQDVPRRKAMAQAAPEWIAGSFTLDDMIAQVAATYDEALAEWQGKTQG